jgi:hypothetical protein
MAAPRQVDTLVRLQQTVVTAELSNGGASASETSAPGDTDGRDGADSDAGGDTLRSRRVAGTGGVGVMTAVTTSYDLSAASFK